MPQITFLPEGITVAVPAGTTILQAARSVKIELRTDCEFGWCGTDPFIIRSGLENLSEVEEDERENIRMNHFPKNVRMACVARILGDIVVERYN
ncbi:MAG TPA: 2Fe-2S iron-sulfur cluster binding domain-containing protein [Candidatus Polarisedimenticolia bacterium]|nr:2Fe-2S iron-sulfur cluster binding domain-containing protein [Candidatus Polarisedimenticolia bacterium]